MLENLNKENFWNDLHAKYPQAVDLFCKWIDCYKQSVNWQTIFAPGVKFHDIPVEMQIGILGRFSVEKEDGNILTNDDMGHVKKEVTEAFLTLQEQLKAKA